ncbi:interleukin-15 isoform X2 [Alosa pseudoharengus]|uniref:interleukin-15 isoform X2 n=1 Tax=Alosa pseudoharengus TaxID=34774 RepID=UPI003F8B11A5
MCFDIAASRAFCSIVQMILQATSFIIGITCFLPGILRRKKGLRCVCLLRGAVYLAHPFRSEASDVMLYTPDINVIIKEKGCECFFMKCYLLELNVYWEENEIVQDPILKDNLEAIEECLEKKSNICSPCEAQPVANISMFSSSLNDTLDYFSTLGNDEDIYCTC